MNESRTLVIDTEIGGTHGKARYLMRAKITLLAISALTTTIKPMTATWRTCASGGQEKPASGAVKESSGLGKAINYFNHHYDQLIGFWLHETARLDNNVMVVFADGPLSLESLPCLYPEGRSKTH